jgi:SAM-dependent methyltransferase
LERIVREIKSDLRVIENNGSLYEDSSFVDRAEALDVLEFHIIARIESALQTTDRVRELTALKQRAELLAQRLEETDERLFQRLRSDIRSGHYTGADLKHQLNEYAERAANATDQDVGYDALDTFVNGLLAIGVAPEETRDREPEMVAYQPTPARVLLELVEKVDLGKHDVFYDLGSGLGRVPILVNLLTGARTKGVEFEPAYCHYAQQCAKGLNLSRVEFVNLDAREADYSDGSVFFLYTPFEGQLLQAVLDMLRELSGKRALKVCAYGPCVPQVSNQEWLVRLDRDADPGPGLALFQSRAGEHARIADWKAEHDAS